MIIEQAQENVKLLNKKSRILFATHTRPNYMPPPAYSENMLICSPYYPDFQDEHGNIRSIKLPEKRQYDLAGLIQSLPSSQQPDLVIARLDASFQHIPGNIRAIPQPTIALIGDTHHMRRPLQSMLGYLLHEHFDHLLIDHTPQHAHWFAEAGLGPVFWISGTLLADDWIAPCDKPEKHIIFIGQMGKAHPIRNAMLESLQQADLPLSVEQVPQAVACQHYNQAAITFNHSLNGDFNLRVFEALASGGFLLTEKLQPQAGLDAVFKDGEHLVCYNDKEDLINKCRYYLENTEERNQIAHAGHLKAKQLFSINNRLHSFEDLLMAKPHTSWFPEIIDRRVQAYGCRNRDDLFQRMAYYEWIQEQHRAIDHLLCHVSPNADPRVACDLVDLPRVSFVLENNPEVLKLAEASGIEGNRFKQKTRITKPVKIQLLASQDLDSVGVLPDSAAVIITDWLAVDEIQRQKIQHQCANTKLTAANHSMGIYHNNLEWSDVWNKPPHA